MGMIVLSSSTLSLLRSAHIVLFRGWDIDLLPSFTLTRTIPNWSAPTLHALLLSLLATHHPSYRGHTTITFPITHSKVTVHSPDKVNRFFSQVTKVFTGVKKYEVVKSVWPYASGPRGEEGRRCVVVEEEEWFEVWKAAILRAVKEGRKGWVGGEDLVEGWMEGL